MGENILLMANHVCPKLSLAHKPLLLQRYLARLDTSILWMTAEWRTDDGTEWRNTWNILKYGIL